jgi:hypothetical protein
MVLRGSGRPARVPRLARRLRVAHLGSASLRASDDDSVAAQLQARKDLVGPATAEPPGTPAPVQYAHAFAEAYGTGYVTESSDGSTLCLVSSPASTSAPVYLACGSTANAERYGILASFPLDGGTDYQFVALVPVSGTVTLTDNGTATAVPVDSNGIAVGVLTASATVAVHVGDATNAIINVYSAPASSTAATGSTAATAVTGATP